MSYPVMLNLEGRLVLVVGGGRVALRKTRGFLEAGAVVRLVAPALTQELANLARAGEIEWLAREYDTLDLEGCWLAVAATDSEETNRRVGEEADQAGIWVNVVDRPEICGFSVPAHFRQGELTVSVSTGGASPMLAARIKNDLASLFDPTWADYCRLLSALRTRVLGAGQGSDENKKVFEAVLEADLLSPLRAGDRAEVEARLKKAAGVTLEDLEATP